MVSSNGSENTQLNLFLHQVTPNSGWRNERLPSRDADGSRLTNAPLGLDLHYLISAYGAEDLHAEICWVMPCSCCMKRPCYPQRREDGAQIRRLSRHRVAARAARVGGVRDWRIRSSESDYARNIEYRRNVEDLDGGAVALPAHGGVQSQRGVGTVSLLPARAALPVLVRGPVDPATGRDRGVIAQPNLLSALSNH